MALAVGRALEPAVHDRKMSRGRTGKPTSIDAPILLADGNPASPTAADQIPKPAKRRRRDTAAFEQRIGYRFKDAALLEQALTHISALSGARNRAASYQRLEFLGDHVLGLVISDMLFRAFAKADEGEMSRRLADLVRKEACADVGRAIGLGAIVALSRWIGSPSDAGAEEQPGDAPT